MAALLGSDLVPTIQTSVATEETHPAERFSRASTVGPPTEQRLSTSSQVSNSGIGIGGRPHGRASLRPAKTGVNKVFRAVNSGDKSCGLTTDVGRMGTKSSSSCHWRAAIQIFRGVNLRSVWRGPLSPLLPQAAAVLLDGRSRLSGRGGMAGFGEA